MSHTITREEALALVKEQFIDRKGVECGSNGYLAYEFQTDSYIEECIHILYEEAIKPKAILPEEPTEEMLAAIMFPYRDWVKLHEHHRVAGKLRYDALYAALTTPPKPKTKRVWCVSWKENDTVQMLHNEDKKYIDRNREGAIKLGYTHVSPVYETEVPA